MDKFVLDVTLVRGLCGEVCFEVSGFVADGR